MSITVEQVREALAPVKDPEIGRTLLELGMIKDIQVSGNDTDVTVELTTAACPLKSTIENSCRDAIKAALPSIGTVNIHLTARDSRKGTAKSTPLPGVKNIIAVASGKGGVGKSTVSANLAVALADMGHRVAVLDMDFYGPSIPKMFGITEEKPTVDNDMIIPVVAYDVKVISIGFFVEDDSPVIWRGPMVHAALKQFVEEVKWGEIDYFILDLPPGTGDIQLSMVNMLPVTGAVIVSTPQDVALLDARKAVSMFASTGVEILGIVENMSYHICPECNHKSHIFGDSGARKYAEEKKFPFLGDLPLELSVRQTGDGGKPFFLCLDENDELRQRFAKIARNLVSSVDVRNLTKPAAAIVSRQPSGCH
ncbi:Mrp/NBP35 family ATP-binding protein [Desulfurispirillum indicum]|uniref:Mrp/NBP35 family ATP-binding protein n=1 Tax=Desulfurispirillum indicum TaxID=936456 RepID=UPI001CFA16DD|nr:Mrp/NBP35 family ATP-binding protein [Desulfurispirillum indicum]UCZ57596.1 Mrp/NBP35 family ATP-binding protein [Desulfurispirillum indicum]